MDDDKWPYDILKHIVESLVSHFTAFGRYSTVYHSNPDIREYTFTVGLSCMGTYLLICTPLPYIESFLHYTSFNYDQSFIHIKEPCL